MKRILITGKDSYIGTSFEKWVSMWPEKYEVATVDTINNQWKAIDFSSFDVILHVAAIVHKKEKKELADLYEKINCNLPIEISQKAKLEGVKQFIFMSTMSVYGIDTGVVDQNTLLNPKTLYGKSKLKAENKLKKIESNCFKITIIRPPMVYGKYAKGNYRRLAKVARKIPIFPDIQNERSMIYIDNLCEAIRIAIEKEKTGILFPQNKEYVQTTELVKNIAVTHGKAVLFIKWFNPLIQVGIKKSSFMKKIFGSLVYEKSMSTKDGFNYCLVGFEESIKITETQNK
ncbi:NAD-dependent epimerase/dehydratase family protein [Eubacterium limosum]|uniref:NAD-dependent epimerase/dehydratase family protein n=1 Tax=Eubacterium limosum TaxID=1736 RepID=UPI0022DFABD4|nr:NAD-dependent epimerase/dehydratase family protein [Eubacterium limosum]